MNNLIVHIEEGTDQTNWVTRLKNQSRVFPIGLIVLVFVLSGAGAAAGTVLSGGSLGKIQIAISQALLLDGRAFDTGDITYGDGSSLHRSFAAANDQDTAFQAAAEIATGDKFLIALPLRNASKTELTGVVTLGESEPPGLQMTVSERSVLPLTAAIDEDAAARGAPLIVGPHSYNVRYWPLVDNDNDGDVDTSDVTMTVTGAGSSVTVISVNALTGTVGYTINGANAASLLVTYKYGSEITMLSQVGPNKWLFKAASILGTNRSGDIEIIIAHPDDGLPGYYRINGKIEQVGMGR